MPTVIAAATEDEMIATFLRGELGSSRFRALLDQALERHGFAIDLIEFPDTSNAVANRMRSGTPGDIPRLGSVGERVWWSPGGPRRLDVGRFDKRRAS